MAKGARRDLGHTETIHLKLHPDLMEWVQAEAIRNYCSEQEVIRRLIITARTPTIRETPAWAEPT